MCLNSKLNIILFDQFHDSIRLEKLSYTYEHILLFPYSINYYEIDINSINFVIKCFSYIIKS